MTSKLVTPRETGFDREDIHAFLTLRSIENALRELIIEELSRAFGTQWHKSQVPDDVRQRFKDAVLAPLRAFFQLAQTYQALFRSMGDGYRVERWLTEKDFEAVTDAVRATWDALGIADKRE